MLRRSADRFDEGLPNGVFPYVPYGHLCVATDVGLERADCRFYKQSMPTDVHGLSFLEWLDEDEERAANKMLTEAFRNSKGG